MCQRSTYLTGLKHCRRFAHRRCFVVSIGAVRITECSRRTYAPITLGLSSRSVSLASQPSPVQIASRLLTVLCYSAVASGEDNADDTKIPTAPNIVWAGFCARCAAVMSAPPPPPNPSSFCFGNSPAGKAKSVASPRFQDCGPEGKNVGSSVDSSAPAFLIIVVLQYLLWTRAFPCALTCFQPY